MNQTEITKAIRRAIREPSPDTVTNTDIANVTVRGVQHFGLKIKELDPEFFNKHISISSNTNIFDWPSDCTTILKVWDMGTSAGDITGIATAGGLCSVTCVAHGFSSDDIITIHDVLGTTEANGTWKITVVSVDVFTLTGSTFANAWTSGGKCFKETGVSKSEIKEIGIAESTLRNDRVWFPRGKTIVVDDPAFTNDVIVDYIFRPSAITDIPSEYHEGLVSFGVIDLIFIPQQDHPNFPDRISQLQRHQRQLVTVEQQLNNTLRMSFEPYNIPDDGDYICD